jgi:hypothetical protein
MDGGLFEWLPMTTEACSPPSSSSTDWQTEAGCIGGGDDGGGANGGGGDGGGANGGGGDGGGANGGG